MTRRISNTQKFLFIHYQGPGKFEPSDMDTILVQSNNLAFARKFDGDVTSPVRLYALEIAAGKYYEELKQKHVTQEMLR